MRTHANQRNSNRVEAAAFAHVIEGNKSTGPYMVENLSAGGALLCGNDPPPLGSTVRIALSLPIQGPVVLDATVVRQEISDDTCAFALSFHHDSATTEDLLQEYVLGELELMLPKPPGLEKARISTPTARLTTPKW